MDYQFESHSYADVRKAGQQLVAKRNDFIQNTRYNLNLLENKIFLYIISKVKPGDTQDTEYEYRYSELFALLRYKTDSYQKVKDMIQSMNALSFWKDAENDDEEDQLISFFESDSVRSNWKKGYFKIKFGKKIFPYIMDLQNQLMENGEFFTSYQLENVILMSRFYSQRLYEILKSYSYNNDTYWFELGTGTEYDLQKRLAGGNKDGIPPEGWKNWFIFNRDVLKPAKQDINRYTDLQIEYEPSKYDRAGKHHRGYVMITFALRSKTKGQMQEREQIIEAAYREIQIAEDSKRYHQSTIFEFMAQQNQREDLEIQKELKEAELRETEQQIEAENELEERISASRIPILTAEFGEFFTDEQLMSLYDAACGDWHIEPGSIRVEDREMFASELIGKYWFKIQATMDETRTKPFNRLLDAVEKDYEHYSYEINEYYKRMKDFSIIKEENTASSMQNPPIPDKGSVESEEINNVKDHDNDQSFEGMNNAEKKMDYYKDAFKRMHF